ncbi:MAG: hypothetical protein LBT08_06645 [Synergistaceae bacterium]|jgi:spore germination protein YaaH|nr:hypothetical protein [Synergistaceae bacterium]
MVDEAYVTCVSIDYRTPSKTVLTRYSAIIRTYADEEAEPDVWLPSELIADLKMPLKLNAEKNAFTLRISQPSERLGIPALKQLAPDALDLDFPVLSADNILHFNASGVENCTGLSFLLPGAEGNNGPRLLIGTRSQIPREGAKTDAQKELEELSPPFNILWDHIAGNNPDLAAEETNHAASVLSPTWFALSSESGGISNKASRAYVASAHARGYHVWALVSNSFNNGRTKKFLGSKTAQNAFIARMIAYAGIYGFDGINIDFEAVANDDAAKLTAFVNSLTTAARTLGLTMSIDVMIPTNWSKAYERKKLSGAVDYIAVMTYDEHWRTAPTAGSTASLPWVRAAIDRTLSEVPASKLLLGIPLYTREWTETKDKKGKATVKSVAMAMPSVDLRLGETSSQMKWLSDIGQNYFQFTEGGKTHKIWVEDERSIALRMEIVNRKKLAGAAFWRKGFEKPEIWEKVREAMEAY